MLALVTLKVNIGAFGASVMGLWFSIASLFTFAGVIDLGTNLSAVVHIAEARSRGDKFEMARTLGAHAALMSIVAVLVCSGAYVVARMLYLRPSFESVMRRATLDFVICCLLITALIQYVSRCCRAFLEGVGDYVALTRILIAGNVVTVVLVLIVALMGRPVEYLAIATVLGAATGGALLTVRYVISNRRHGVGFAQPGWEDMRRLLRTGLAVQMSTVFGMFVDPMIKYAMGRFVGVSEVSDYEIARRFTIAGSDLFGTAFRTLLRKSASQTESSALKQFVGGSLQKVSRFGIGYIGLIFGIASAVPYVLMKYWFAREAAFEIYLILVPQAVLNILFYPYYASLIGLRKTNVVACMQLLNLSMTAVTVFVGYGLFRSHWGLVGYTVSILLGNLYMIRRYRTMLNLDIAANLLGEVAYKAALLVCACLVGAGLALAGPPLYAVAVVSLVSGLLFHRNILEAAGIVRTSIGIVRGQS